MRTSVNICDCINWWENGAGELKAGQFDVALYIKFLEKYNSMTFEERCKKQ